MYSTSHNKNKLPLFSRPPVKYHENQAAPPALSTGGKMQFGVTAVLLCCLESDLLEDNLAPVPDAMILDG